MSILFVYFIVSLVIAFITMTLGIKKLFSDINEVATLRNATLPDRVSSKYWLIFVGSIFAILAAITGFMAFIEWLVGLF